MKMPFCANHMCEMHGHLIERDRGNVIVVPDRRAPDGTEYTKQARRHLYVGRDRDRKVEFFLCDCCHHAVEMTK